MTALLGGTDNVHVLLNHHTGIHFGLTTHDHLLGHGTTQTWPQYWIDYNNTDGQTQQQQAGANNEEDEEEEEPCEDEDGEEANDTHDRTNPRRDLDDPNPDDHHDNGGNSTTANRTQQTVSYTHLRAHETRRHL
eukprot:411393-Prorocentrum_lima.AAC.1